MSSLDKQVRMLLSENRLQEAESICKQQCEIEPGTASNWEYLGITQQRLGKHTEAASSCRHALDLDTECLLANFVLGTLLQHQGHLAEALGYYRKAVSINPDYAAAHLAMANVLHHSGRMQESITSYQKLAELEPGSVDAVLGQARVLEQLGEYQKCYSLLQPLLDAGCKDAIPTFFDISKHIGQRERAASDLEGLLRNKKVHDETAAAIHFRLGKHNDECGDYDKAFFHYQQANSLAGSQFDKEKLTRYVNDCISIYNREFLRHMPQAGNRSNLPLFIVGMPRTGTSLVEQILASHPDVFGAGELSYIPELVQRLTMEFPGFVAPLYAGYLTQPLLDTQAEQHLRALQALGKNAARVSDKLPHNFRNIGLIAQLFPAARIINCTRHPLDTCLSCYMANFGTAAHGYTYNLETMGEYYIQYHRLMEHWRSVFQDRILEVPYAQLVQEQEATSRELIKFCDLKWDDKCLDFHQSERFIFTLSYDQVRKPVYTNSLNRWKKYEKHLQPLRELLESAGINCD